MLIMPVTWFLRKIPVQNWPLNYMKGLKMNLAQFLTIMITAPMHTLWLWQEG